MTPDYIDALAKCMPDDYSVTSAVIHQNSFAVIEILHHPSRRRRDVKVHPNGTWDRPKRIAPDFEYALDYAHLRLLDTGQNPC